MHERTQLNHWQMCGIRPPNLVLASSEIAVSDSIMRAGVDAAAPTAGCTGAAPTDSGRNADHCFGEHFTVSVRHRSVEYRVLELLKRNRCLRERTAACYCFAV